MKSRLIAAAGGLLAIPSLVIAGPAAADSLSGPYTATVLDGLANYKSTTYTFSPCGSGCTHLAIGDGPVGGDLHLKGNMWTGALNNAGTDCTEAVNGDTLVATRTCGTFVLTHQLTKS
jgi:hypothetical protein